MKQHIGMLSYIKNDMALFLSTCEGFWRAMHDFLLRHLFLARTYTYIHTLAAYLS